MIFLGNFLFPFLKKGSIVHTFKIGTHHIPFKTVSLFSLKRLAVFHLIVLRAKT
jgi:hypothetical protein